MAAAGRRRRSSSGPTSSRPPLDDEQELDIDDVMFETEGEAAEGEELAAEAEEEEDLPEPDDDEEEWEFADEDEEEEMEDDGAGEGELEGWDAALANFDTAQDVQQQAEEAAAATQAEKQEAAALKLVRSGELAAGTEVEVMELPEEVPHRDKTFDEQTVALSPADKEALAANRQAYAVFPMDRIELLVSEAPDGKLCLADCFIRDTVEDLFSRPTVEAGIPQELREYQLLPWEHTNTGDGLKHIDPKVTLMRMYFVGLGTADGPDEVDMGAVLSFDAADRRMHQHEIVTLGEMMTEPVLRIREDGVYVEDAVNVPGTVSVAEGFAGHPEDYYLYPDREFDMREFVKMGLWPDPELPADGDGDGGDAAAAGAEGESEVEQGVLEERLEELELMEELDDMPDVPAVDMV